MFTAFPPAPWGSFMVSRLPHPPFGSWPLGSRQESGGLGAPRTWRCGAARPRRALGLARAATGETWRSANYTASRRRAPGGGSQRLRGDGSGEGGEAGVLPHGGAATCRGRGQSGPGFSLLRRAGAGRTHPDHEARQRHREPGFPELARHPAPFLRVALSRRGLCLARQFPGREFAATRASGAPEVAGATSACSNSP